MIISGFFYCRLW